MRRFVRQPVFYPVSTVFVDDHPGFLDALRGTYRNGPLNRFFSSPREALNFLTSQHRRGTPERLSGSQFSDFEKRSFNALGLDALTDVTRFDEVAAVVADYEMDEMNGVEVFAALADMPCTKILLTGVATEREAVEAFNAGVIDLYVKKSAPDMTEKLTRALTDAKARHCAERGMISANDVGSTYCDARALAAMQTIVERERIVEYYWRLDQNAVLMFDASGQPSVFLVWDADEWAFQCGIVADEGDISPLRREMEARRIMPLYWPFQAYRAGMMGVPSIQPLPVPGWDGAFYGWSRLESAVLEPNMSTYARWRKAQMNSDHRPDSFAI